MRRNRSTNLITRVAAIAAMALAGVPIAAADTQWFAGDNTSLGSTNRFGSAPTGPFNAKFVSGNVLGFGVPNGRGIGAGLTVAGITATENFTITTTSGTILNANNGVIPINVAAGKVVDFDMQAFTSAATAGYIKTGGGVLAFAGGSYGGGFTLESGTVVVRGVNAFGSGFNNTLTLNGGVVASSLTRTFNDKFNRIVIGGDVQFGALATSLPIANSSGSLGFPSPTSIGSAVRKLTLGNNGTMTFSGVIEGDGGITLDRLAGANGSFIFNNDNNTYTGVTRLAGGRLYLNTTVASNNNLSKSSMIRIDAGAELDVINVGGAGGFTIAPGQVLAGRGTLVGGTTIGNTSTVTGGSGPTDADTVGNLTLSTSFGVQTTFGDGGTYAWKMADATLAPGTGWDQLTISNLNVDALSAATPFHVDLIDAGDAALADGSAYRIAHADAFSGATLAKLRELFVIRTNELATDNPGTYGLSFTASGSGFDMNVVYEAAAAPEPTTTLLFTLGSAAVLGGRRRDAQRQPTIVARLSRWLQIA